MHFIDEAWWATFCVLYLASVVDTASDAYVGYSWQVRDGPADVEDCLDRTPVVAGPPPSLAC